ncbi:hypothetical protein FOA24_14945 [Bacillus thuringiensis]|uniref:hypothetical protein n=1 Tax=Bacillus thuringiensis TaxID=1428 RepID=UPI003338C20D
MDELKAVNEQVIATNLKTAEMSAELRPTNCFTDASYKESNLREIVYELDDGIGQIGAKVSTLEDVEVLLGRLVEDMDRVVSKGEEKYYFHEFHRKMRVYWRLINYTMSELHKDYEKAAELKEELFNKVVKGSNEEQ